MSVRLKWPEIVASAETIVRSYNTGVTLRQLFYRLVSRGVLPNTTSAYKTLSTRTAEARRAGWFPSLIDRTRTIRGGSGWDSPSQAINLIAQSYRRDRAETQPHNLYLGVEKNGMIEQLSAWFGARSFPILALGGYASQTFVDEVARDVGRNVRPSVLIYAGDFDPSGEDIQRDFIERVGAFDAVRHIALTIEQVDEYGLPPLAGKTTDSRAAGFIARHGVLMQVELDALDPDDLRRLYTEAVEDYWDDELYQQVLTREANERDRIMELAERADDEEEDDDELD